MTTLVADAAALRWEAWRRTGEQKTRRGGRQFAAAVAVCGAGIIAWLTFASLQLLGLV